MAPAPAVRRSRGAAPAISSPTSTTTRPRTCPRRSRGRPRSPRSSGIVVVMAASLSRSRSCASRRQASSRSGLRGHAEFDAEERHAAQDEGRDRGRQVHAAGEPAGGDRAAVARSSTGGWRACASRPSRCRPPSAPWRAAWPGPRARAVDDLGGAETLEVVRLLRPAGRGDHVPAGLREQRDGDRADAAGRARDDGRRRAPASARAARAPAGRASRCSRRCRSPSPARR